MLPNCSQKANRNVGRRYCLAAVIIVVFLFVVSFTTLDYSSGTFKVTRPQYGASFVCTRKPERFADSTCEVSRHFSQMVLAVNFNNPFYENIPFLLDFYRSAFSCITFCGPVKSSKTNIVVIEHPNRESGYYSYQCLAEVIIRYPNAAGFLYVNDDMVVNWWNLVQFDKQKIWVGKNIIHQAGAELGKPAPTNWHWWKSINALQLCEAALNEITSSKPKLDRLTSLLQNSNFSLEENFSKNTGGIRKCLRGWSDFFYIPQNFSKLFVELSSIFYNNRVFLEVAVPTIIFLLESNSNLINIDGMYLPDLYGDIDFTSGTQFFQTYNVNMTFLHPFKLMGSAKTLEYFKSVITPLSKKHGSCSLY